jgi:GcrA cell cycle regulator
MQSSDWPKEHSKMLRELHAKGMSYAQIAKHMNVLFGTAYTRNAALSRGKRIGLVVSELAKERQRAGQGPKMKPPRTGKRQTSKSQTPKSQTSSCIQPVTEPAEPIKLRCVGVTPRLISLLELEAGDCRYPYGGDKEGDPIVFCGHPRRRGSPYCTAHFHLTRDLEGLSQRPAKSVAPFVPRLVVAA